MQFYSGPLMHLLSGLDSKHTMPARWVQRQVEETGKPVVLRASSMLMHLEAIRAGTGRGVLPC